MEGRFEKALMSIFPGYGDMSSIIYEPRRCRMKRCKDPDQPGDKNKQKR
jgi:hypothetical protein